MHYLIWLPILLKPQICLPSSTAEFLYLKTLWQSDFRIWSCKLKCLFLLTYIISYDWSTLEHFCITWSHETLSVSLKTEGSRAQTTNYHRFDSDSWEQLMKFNVKTYLIISPLSGLVTDMSEVSTKSRWSTHLRQYEITRIIFTTDSCLFEKTSKTKIPLISLSNCCRWDSTYITGKDIYRHQGEAD